jgi:hypothetical protein
VRSSSWATALCAVIDKSDASRNTRGENFVAGLFLSLLFFFERQITHLGSGMWAALTQFASRRTYRQLDIVLQAVAKAAMILSEATQRRMGK